MVAANGGVGERAWRDLVLILDAGLGDNLRPDLLEGKDSAAAVDSSSEDDMMVM